MLADRWDRIHDRIGKPGIPLEAGKKNSIRKAPTKSASGPAVASYSPRLKLGKLFPVL